ncbi:secreted aspartic protease 5 [Diutina catenulata]
MLSNTFLLTLLLSLLAQGLVIRDDPSAKSGVLALPLTKSSTKNNNPKSAPLAGGSGPAPVPDNGGSAPGTNSETLYSQKWWYSITLGIGSNKQQVSLNIDTGSSDLWVDETYLQDTSSWKSIGEHFQIGYGDESAVSGTYGKGNIVLEDGTVVKNLQWALADNVDLTGGDSAGIVGIGKDANEATSDEYPNFTSTLKSQGIIKTAGYSYFLNTEDASEGQVVFGGIDKAKIKGEVQKLAQGTKYPQFDSADLSSLTLDDGTELVGKTELIFDSGTTLIVWSQELIDKLNFSGVYQLGHDLYIPCDQPTDKHVNFNFGKVSIKLSYKDLAVKAFQPNGDDSGKCFFAFQPGSDDLPILGDAFLRKAYITVNHEDGTVSVSNVNYTDKTDIVAL